MKKYLNYIFILLIYFMFTSQVSAESEFVCKYKGYKDDPLIGKYEYNYELHLNIDVENIISTKLTGTKQLLEVDKCKKNSKYLADFGDEEEMVKKFCVSTKKNLEFKTLKLQFKIIENDECPNSIVVLNNSTTTDIYKGTQKPDYNSYPLDKKIIKNSDKYYCGNVTGIPKKIPELTSWSMSMIQVAVPIILVILGSIDLFKGITAQKEDEIKKGQQTFIKRLVIAVLIFFIVVIIKFFVSILANGNDSNFIDCIDCFLSNDCN